MAHVFMLENDSKRFKEAALATSPSKSSSIKPSLAGKATGKSSLSSFTSKVSSLMEAYLDTLNDRSLPVVQFASPDDLQKAFGNAGIPISLSKDKDGCRMEKLVRACELVIQYSVRTGHAHFFNQLFGRVDRVSLAGDWLTAAVNTSLYTYEVAPVFTLMERETISKMASYVGPAFHANHEGIFVPGGSIANLYALHLARFRCDRDFGTRGAIGGPRLVAFTSCQAHYSFTKSCIVIGIGSSNCVKVECDELGAMIPSALKRAVAETIAQGGRPFFVVATAGSTVVGSFDPIRPLAEICRENDMWLHVDGVWGGAALLSPKHRGLLDGADLADSFSWNPHKMMGVTLQCSALLLRQSGQLRACNALNAEYLFQPDKNYSDLDVGDGTIQCGRRVDSLKLWLAWKACGDEGYARLIEHSIGLAEYCERSIVRSNGVFVLAYPRSYSNVCFWYVPPSMRPFDHEKASKEQLEAMSIVAPRLKNVMQCEGAALIGYQPLDDRPNFFRIVFASVNMLTTKDVDDVLASMDRLGSTISLE